MYENILVLPMREEVTRLGFKQLLRSDEVDKELLRNGLTFVFINSVCGCAAGKARPGLALAINWAKENKKLPDNLITAFAGIEVDVVKKVRTYFNDFPPSSPQMGLLKNGVLIDLIQRNEIENENSDKVADKIINLFKKHCN